ncbi:MAG: glycosyltransferase [Patescibacteria group bacterium]
MKVIMISRDKGVLDKESAVSHRIAEYKELFDDLEVVFIGGQWKIFSFLSAFPRAAWIARRFGKGAWITSQDPFESGIVALSIAKLFGLRLQFQLHTDVFSYFYPRHSLMNFCRMICTRALIPRANSLRVVSEKIRNEIVERHLLPEQKIFVLPIYVEKENDVHGPSYDLRAKYPEFEKIILIVARLEREKNLPLALESFQKVLRGMPKAGLVILGEGRQRAKLRDFARHLNIIESVRFEGWQTDTASAYQSADLLLVTSFYEGYGMNIIEALAAGCPVVSTDVGIAGEAGAIISNYDAGDIALKSLEILRQNKRGVLSSGVANLTKQEYLEKFKNTFV